MQVEMTQERISSLRTYLMMTEDKRKEEVDVREKVAEEKQEGTEEKRIAESNVDFFKGMNKDIEEIQKVLDKVV